MGIFGFCVTFIILWWLVFFAVLPFGVRGQLETGEAIPRGAEPAAPSNPRLKTKALIASAFAAPLTIVVWALVTFHLLGWLTQV
jgi:predicted secreted protein